jgi:hypothetical protein
MADRSSKAMWARHLAEVSASGETTAPFCGGVTSGRRPRVVALEARSEAPVRFVDLEMSAPVGTALSASAPLEILVDGVVLRVEVGTSTGYVAALVANLRGRKLIVF